MSNEYKLIGKDFTPPDVTGKVTGKAKYAEDFRVDGMVFARMYTSPMAHGQVTKIDTSKAEAMEGVVGILTAEDVPEVEPPGSAILTNTPVYIGDPILAVAAETEQLAEDAMALIEVEIEPLPFVTDPLDSLLDGGPNARIEGNVFAPSSEGSGLRTVKWSQEILKKSPLSIRMLKGAMNADCDGQAGLQQFAGDATMLFYMSEEAQEGRDAFKEKRKPNFKKFPRLP